ncbi:response regulator transcription factor [Nonomuraea sp. SMC257]|uniref:Response regulator transcription factor n=1 Tax=Nonomuraea montanisoli TaxID=2741721 RepID=A0A7Y6M6B0_9ACTN|nr:response regulator transcription factor [Nonomuraea montanisoli]NUW35450.1 response regulator transcription factor [Nonomuraea montanisoli]
MPIRILIADDQEGIRGAFRLILDAQPDMTVVAEAADGLAAIEEARRLRPDVVLTDVRMPLADGIEVARALADTDIHVVVVTTFGLEEYVRAALRHGASGFVLKRSGPALLVEAVRAAVSGDVLISPQLTVGLLRRDAPAPEESGAPDPGLTAREEEVVRLVAQARTNAEIAEELFLSPGTVKNHIAAVQRKLGARNRVGIAAWAWSTGRAAASPP